MAQTNDETFLKKGLSKNNYEIISELGFRADYDGEIRIALNKARLAERAKCIAQLKDHQAHCDNCAKDNIEMAIIILEKNEAIE